VKVVLWLWIEPFEVHIQRIKILIRSARKRPTGRLCLPLCGETSGMGHEPPHFRCPLRRRHRRWIHHSALFSYPSLSDAKQFPGMGARQKFWPCLLPPRIFTARLGKISLTTACIGIFSLEKVTASCFSPIVVAVPLPSVLAITPSFCYYAQRNSGKRGVEAFGPASACDTYGYNLHKHRSRYPTPRTPSNQQ
jgi:hypothetical protein